jgi:hypothetical protein
MLSATRVFRTPILLTYVTQKDNTLTNTKPSHQFATCDLHTISAHHNTPQFKTILLDGSKAPRSLYPSTERQWLVSFMFRPLRCMKQTPVTTGHIADFDNVDTTFHRLVTMLTALHLLLWNSSVCYPLTECLRSSLQVLLCFSESDRHNTCQAHSSWQQCRPCDGCCTSGSSQCEPHSGRVTEHVERIWRAAVVALSIYKAPPTVGLWHAFSWRAKSARFLYQAFLLCK